MKEYLNKVHRLRIIIQKSPCSSNMLVLRAGYELAVPFPRVFKKKQFAHRTYTLICIYSYYTIDGV